MAYNDTVTDALTVQASKFDVPDGCEWLNGLCYMMQGIGAIAGALMAGFVQKTAYLGPFECFGIYMALQMTFFVLAYFMNQNMEPGEIRDLQLSEPPAPQAASSSADVPQDEAQRLLEGSEAPQAPQADQGPSSCCSRLALNFKLIWRAAKNQPIYATIIFFLVRGLLVPTFDNIQAYFLLNKAGITNDEYDFLSIGQSIGTLVGTIIYMTCLTRYQAWKLVGLSVFFQLVHTWLLYANVMRWTLVWGFSDWSVNLVLMLFN